MLIPGPVMIRNDSALIVLNDLGRLATGDGGLVGLASGGGNTGLDSGSFLIVVPGSSPAVAFSTSYLCDTKTSSEIGLFANPTLADLPGADPPPPPPQPSLQGPTIFFNFTKHVKI